jgi:hypothetical protein
VHWLRVFHLPPMPYARVARQKRSWVTRVAGIDCSFCCRLCNRPYVAGGLDVTVDFVAQERMGAIVAKGGTPPFPCTVDSMCVCVCVVLCGVVQMTRGAAWTPSSTVLARGDADGSQEHS